MTRPTREHRNPRGYQANAAIVTAYTNSPPVTVLTLTGGTYIADTPDDLHALADMYRAAANDLRHALATHQPPETQGDLFTQDTPEGAR